jgi:hypothetical protein
LYPFLNLFLNVLKYTVDLSKLTFSFNHQDKKYYPTAEEVYGPEVEVNTYMYNK